MDYGPVKDFDQRDLDRSLSPAVGFLAGHPVYGNLSVNSGRRSKSSNRKAGGAKKSQHLLGKALDLDVSRLSNAQKSQLLSDLASYGIKGIGIYAGGQTIHIDARKNFATWGPSPKGKYAGVEISQQPRWARQALTAIQQAGPYKAFPAAPAAVPGTASLAIGPAGTSLADVYRTAQYQRAMPEGPTPPATAPVPTSRPIDSIGGLGALAVKGSRVAPSSLPAPAGERFGQTSPASLDINQSMAPSIMGNAYGQWAKPMAAATLNDMMTGRNMPVGPMPAARMPDQSQRFRPSAAPAPAAPVGRVATPAISPARNEQIARDVKAAATQTMMERQVGQSQRFRPDMASAQATPDQQRQAHFVNAVSRSLAPAAPAPAAQKSYYNPAKEYAYAGLTRSLAPATPVGMVATPAPQTRSISTTPAPTDMVKATPMAQQPASSPIGAVNQPLGPANAPPAALDAARNLGTATAAQQIAPPAAMDAARKLGTAIAAQQIAAPATLAEKVSQPAQTAQTAQQRTAQQAQQAQQRGLPAGVAGPWGADIAMQQQPAVGPTTTQATAQPQRGFLGTIGQGIKAAAPVIGSLALGPLGGLLGASIASAKPGQVLGNPFQGLANTAKAMGMFQSGTPYSGPISNYGTGLKAIGDVLGGAAPVGARAYSRSTPGYSVTSLPNGMVQRTNQYGFTSFERPSMGPTGSSFPGGFSGGFGGFFGGGQQSGKSSGGRTSGGKSSSRSGGGRKSERSESAGY